MLLTSSVASSSGKFELITGTITHMFISISVHLDSHAESRAETSLKYEFLSGMLDCFVLILLFFSLFQFHLGTSLVRFSQPSLSLNGLPFLLVCILSSSAIYCLFQFLVLTFHSLSIRPHSFPLIYSVISLPPFPVAWPDSHHHSLIPLSPIPFRTVLITPQLNQPPRAQFNGLQSLNKAAHEASAHMGSQRRPVLRSGT